MVEVTFGNSETSTEESLQLLLNSLGTIPRKKPDYPENAMSRGHVEKEQYPHSPSPDTKHAQQTRHREELGDSTKARAMAPSQVWQRHTVPATPTEYLITNGQSQAIPTRQTHNTRA